MTPPSLLMTDASQTATSTPGSGTSPTSAVVVPPVPSAPASSSAPYGLNNGTLPTGTGASTGFVTIAFTVTPSSNIASSSGIASTSATAYSVGVEASSSVASLSSTPSSSSSYVGPSVMATAVMQVYN